MPPHHDVFENAHPPEDPDILERARDAEAGDGVGLEADEASFPEAHISGRGREHSRDDVKSGRLSRAVGPDQAEHLAAPHLEIERVEREDAAEAPGEAPALEKNFPLHLPPPARPGSIA